MRLSILWRIMEIEEGVIRRGRRPRRITPFEISIILYMVRKPNSTIVFYSFKIITSLKTWHIHTFLHRSIDVKFIFHSARLGLFSSANILNSRRRPYSCFLAVLAMFLDITSPSSYSWNEWNVRHFCFHNQNNSTILDCIKN